MYYLIREKNTFNVVKRTHRDNRVWVNAWGTDRHFEYEGVDKQGNKVYFDTRQIVKKSKAKTFKKAFKFLVKGIEYHFI